jgi:metal transporter CNNM
MEYLISLILVILSALFAGLTLGLFSLDSNSLRRRAKHGDADAAKVFPLREKSNRLLITLILGNVVVNTSLSIFLGTLASGLMAGIIASSLIVVFGEIIPQAVITRHALWWSARFAWFIKFVLILWYPIAAPLAKVLDWFLGDELPITYSKRELMDIISEHEDSEHSAVDADEERIVHGALQFSHLRVREVMTEAKNVVSFDENQKLTDQFFEEIGEQGFSRLPVYSGDKSNIIGILYAKDLLTEDDDISIIQTEEAFDRDFITVRPDDLLDKVLGIMLKRRQHLAIVKTKNAHFVGIISLEDIIEEIIQHEIQDEDDDEGDG